MIEEPQQASIAEVCFTPYATHLMTVVGEAIEYISLA